MSISKHENTLCPVCKTDQGHKPNCEMRMLEKLRSKNTHLQCPKCKISATIGINSNNDYECRSCHAQFTTNNISNKLKISLIIDKTSNRIEVAILPNLGSGQFPIDQQMGELLVKIVKKFPVA